MRPRPPNINHELRVCFIGRLVACKGVDCLLRAVDLLHRRGFAIRCTVAGTGPERSQLSALAQHLRIVPLVDFRGHLSADAVRALLRSSDVLALPSRCTAVWEEQFGLVLAEAMAEGTIAVGSRTGSIPEVIGADDLLFDQNDSRGLATILQRLATDIDFQRQSRINAWQRACERFDVNIVAKQKLHFLHEVLDHAGAPVRTDRPVSRLLPRETQ